MSELPEGWTTAKIHELGEVRLGKQRSPKDHSGSRMLPYLRVANVFDSRIDTSDVMSMHFESHEAQTFRLEPGDILLNEGQSLELVGRPAIYDGEVPDCCFTNSLVRFRAGPNIDRRFALQLFRHMMFSGQFAAVANITTNIAHLGLERFAMLEVPVPPVREQQRIVARIDALQARSRAAREALTDVPALLDQLRQSVLAAAFRGDLTAEWRANNPDVEPASALLGRIGRDTPGASTPIDGPALYELPSGWAWAPLEKLAEVQLGQRRAPEYVGLREYPYIRAANITWRGLDLSDVKSMGFGPVEGLLLRPGDVLLNEASGSPREVGKPALWRGEIPNCCFQATVLRLRPTNEISPEWLYFVCLADALLGRYLSLAPGVGILHLTSTRLRRWPVPVPPAEEQAALASVLATQLKKLDDAESALSVLSTGLTTLDQSILARAFRGDLVEQDPHDEPAEALLARLRVERASSGKPVTRRGRG